MVAAPNPLVRPRVVYRAIGPGLVIKDTGLAGGSEVMSGVPAHIVAGRRNRHPDEHIGSDESITTITATTSWQEQGN